jgi:hypothetical protein
MYMSLSKAQGSIELTEHQKQSLQLSAMPLRIISKPSDTEHKSLIIGIKNKATT